MKMSDQPKSALRPELADELAAEKPKEELDETKLL